MTYSLLISPEARSAYFADYLSVAETELAACCPDAAPVHRTAGGMDFLDVEGGDPQAFARLSFVQGVFERQGEALIALECAPDWALHRDFIFGSKFKGKTNERLTQMLINLGLAAIGKPACETTLLDPMCGRATTLLWAMTQDRNRLSDQKEQTRRRRLLRFQSRRRLDAHGARRRQRHRRQLSQTAL